VTTEIYEDVLAANGAFLMFASSDLGATAVGPEDTLVYFQYYGIETGYYVGGPPVSYFMFDYFPFMAVIDLRTGELMDKDYVGGPSDAMTTDEILALVQAANGE
jgi:hypothetical protein